MKTLILSLMAALLLIAADSSAGPVTDQLKTTLDHLVDALKDPALKGEGKKNQRADKLHGILEARFDEEAIARKTLGHHWKKITAEERKEFVRLFSALLERTYFEKIDAQLDKTAQFSSDDIRYLKEVVKGKSAQVSTAIQTGEGSDTPVIYRLRLVKGAWLITDMKIEGVIITKNYRAQFSEILTRNPMSELLEKLKAKQALK
jgi:phospholipid transport system substrate-binding protein